MSQSNKKENIIFGIIIVLIIILSISITYYFIVKHNQNLNDGEIKNNEFTKVIHSDIIDAFKKYPTNPIKFSEDTMTISGLLDKNVENKINEKLKKITPEKTDDDYNYNRCNIIFNYSNVFSINCGVKSLTVDLNTGNDIFIEEIFNNDTDIKSILLSEIYKSACNYMFDCYNTNSDDEYYNQIDSYIYDIYKKVLNKDYTLNLYPNYISIVNIGDGMLNISFYDYSKDVTIYERFLTDKNIYENDVKESAEIYAYQSYWPGEYMYPNNEFIDDKTYISFYLYNSTNNYIGRYSRDSETREELDLKSINDNLIKEIKERYNITTKNNNYRLINGYASIYKDGYDYNLINYELRISEYNKNNFTQIMFGKYDAKEIKFNQYYKTDMILKNNKISYLENDPGKIFANFSEELFEYIKNNAPKENDYENNPLYSIFFGRMDYIKPTSDNIQKIIKTSTYSIDSENKTIYMNNDGIVITLPWEVFTLKDKDEQVIDTTN